MKKISIIIVTYNSTKLIRDCLSSIFNNNDIGDELDVIIVDNDSEDQKELFELIGNDYNGVNIRCYSTGENAGYGKGNNFGIAKTDADIIVVMNPDVRFVSPVFKRIIDEFKAPKLGMAGVDFIDGSSPYYFKPEYNTLFKSLFIHQYIKRKKYNPQTMYMSGSLLVFDRNTFIKAGMYDENIFMYYEEPDITNRIVKEGKEVKWLKDISVLHLAHGRKYNEKLTEIRFKSFEYYCRKYGLSALVGYKREKTILTIKKYVSIMLRDRERFDVFSKTLVCVNTKIKLLQI